MKFGVIYWGIFISLVGFAFFRYGKKRGDGLSMIAGIVLMVYPYLITSLGWSMAFGATICAVYAFLKLVMHL